MNTLNELSQAEKKQRILVLCNENEIAGLQAQGLPLAAHLGEAAARYTYTQNSSGQGSLCTELLLSEDQVLLGAIQYDSTAPEQFSPVLSTE